MEFFDQYDHTIDDKGRLVLPSAYRDAFADGGFLTIMGRSAGLFTPDGWAKHRRRLEAAPEFDRNAMSQVLAFTSPFTPDGQNRITIGQRLRDHVGLEKNVAVVGQGTHAAIYPAEVWKAKSATAVDLVDKFENLGFL